MTLTPETLTILGNFAEINPNFIFKPGSKIATITDSKAILAFATVKETFALEAGISNLGDFLSALKLLPKPNLEFTETDVVISDGRSKLVYRLASTSVMTTPYGKNISIPATDAVFNLKASEISTIRSAASACACKNFSIVGADTGILSVVVSDPKNSASNVFTLELDQPNQSKENFSFVFEFGNLKVVDGDYKVGISKKMISNWVCQTLPVEYWIAADKTLSKVS